ncbi:MAG TPA: peptidylprolyl isomerase [Alphaproteobacteria bacterium]
MRLLVALIMLAMPYIAHAEDNVAFQQNNTAEKAAATGEQLVLETSKGEVVIALRPDLAPLHVARVKELAAAGFYDGIIFHRVIPGFMAQTGDPSGTGTGGSDKPDLKAEFTKTPYVRGTIGAARTSNPNSANSQFFISFGDNGFLNGQYTVWGEVVSGMDNVDKINAGEPPANPDKIIKATIRSAAAAQ